jgi:hypothetical protein
MKSRFASAAGLLATSLGALVMAGCPDSPSAVDAANVPDAVIVPNDTPTTPTDQGLRRDTGRGDSGGSCGTRGNVGGQCAAAECFEPWMCQEEISQDRTTVRRTDGMPGRPYPVRLFPGGQCQGACDPDARNQCNSCSTCLQTGRDVSGNAVGECFQSCAQDTDGRGGCNDGYGCDRGNLACVPACAVVEGADTCQFSFEDRDTDPTTRETIVDEGTSYPSRCNVATGLCESTGTAGATAGDDCEDEFDCEDDGFCISTDDPDGPASLRDGYCIRLGCNEGPTPENPSDLRCADGDVCNQSLFGLPGGVCTDGCTLGAETTAAQRVGAAGGNPGCDAGEACFWDGVHGTADDLNGSCYPGNYNEVRAYNVGALCDDDSDCYSPFGLGRCLFGEGNSLGDRVGGGVCAISGCGQSMAGIGLRAEDGVVPVPDPNQVCQTATGSMGMNNDVCVGFSETQTFCVSGCTAATDCPAGYACTNLGSALSPLNLCWPACSVDADCRSGARCLDERREMCDPMTDSCFCTDAAPRPDAGVTPRDAGTDAPSVPDAAAAPDAFEAPDAFLESPDATAG